MPTALVVIDAQVGLFADGPHEGEAVLSRIAGLLERARGAGVPVVFVQDVDVGGPGTAEFELPPALAPRSGEAVVHKTACDAFHETRLADILRELRAESLVICGMKSQFCIDTSVRRAVTLGFPVQLVGDAHTTEDSAVLPGAAIIAHENATLHGFGVANAVVRVVSSDEVRF